MKAGADEESNYLRLLSEEEFEFEDELLFESCLRSAAVLGEGGEEAFVGLVDIDVFEFVALLLLLLLL